MKWKPVVGFDRYEVSCSGQVRAVATQRILKPRFLRGYVRYALYGGGKKPKPVSAHRLVWEAYVGTLSPELEINHKNGVKSDNRLENLEAVTHAENMAHRKTVLRIQGVRGSRSNLATLVEADVTEIRRLYATGTLTQSQIAERFGISRPNVSLIVTGKTWPHIPL